MITHFVAERIGTDGVVYGENYDGVGIALKDLPKDELLELTAYSVLRVECTAGRPQQQPAALVLVMEDCQLAKTPATATAEPT